jgi:hypothetical protein
MREREEVKGDVDEGQWWGMAAGGREGDERRAGESGVHRVLLHTTGL